MILEDDPLRQLWFQEHFAGQQFELTANVRQAINWLRERNYSLLLLDHDLVYEHYLSSLPDDERSGFAVAAWLAAHPNCQAGARIVIHSVNYGGSERMCEVLRRAGRKVQHIPFPYLPDELL